MKKIQWIKYRRVTTKNFICSSISNPKALDSFDINILDLSSEEIWAWEKDNKDNINIYVDLNNLMKMINDSINKNLLILLPQNINYYYNKTRAYGGQKYYASSCELKNMLIDVIDILSKTIFTHDFTLTFENNITYVDGKMFNSSFYFKASNCDMLTKATDTNKATTIKIDDYILTTLDLKTEDDIFSLLNDCMLIKNETCIPDWLFNYSFLDDESLKMTMKANETLINQKMLEQKEIKDKINQNIEFKKILIESGDELVRIVFEILEKIFSIDLSKFTDIKKEDFIFNYNGITFIGEIKGINSNVKKNNIAQLDDHYTNYTDDMNDDEINKVKGLLIITHQRSENIDNRQPVSNDVIEKAKRDNYLIIESITLLTIYEKFINKELSSESIFNMFYKENGILLI